MVFCYVEENFNGFLNNIVGICNWVGNVLGMMLYLEWVVEVILGNIDGLWVFKLLLENGMVIVEG